MSSLNHPKVRPLTREIAYELGFEPRFIDFLFAATRPACFDYWVSSTRDSWTCNVPEDVDVAYPLWSTNADEMLVCVADGHIRFEQAYHDEPETDRVARTVQGLLARLFMTMYENETSNAELRLAAQACGFRHLPRLLELEKVEPPEDGDFEALVRQVIEDIDIVPE